MQPADAHRAARKCQVLSRAETLINLRAAYRRAAALERALNARPGLVDGSAVRRLLGRGQRRDLLRRLCDLAVLASEVAHTRRLERGVIRASGDLRRRAVREYLQLVCCPHSSPNQKARFRSRAFALGTKAGLRGTTRSPTDSSQGENPLHAARWTLVGSAIGLHPDALFCASARKRIPASRFAAGSQSRPAFPVRRLRGTGLRRCLMKSWLCRSSSYRRDRDSA